MIPSHVARQAEQQPYHVSQGRFADRHLLLDRGQWGCWKSRHPATHPRVFARGCPQKSDSPRGPGECNRRGAFSTPPQLPILVPFPSFPFASPSVSCGSCLPSGWPASLTCVSSACPPVYPPSVWRAVLARQSVWRVALAPVPRATPIGDPGATQAVVVHRLPIARGIWCRDQPDGLGLT
jgi:hypothetical protein